MRTTLRAVVSKYARVNKAMTGSANPYYGIHLLCPQELVIQIRGVQLLPSGVLNRESHPTDSRKGKIVFMEWSHSRISRILSHNYQ